MKITDILDYDWDTVSHMKRSELAKVTSQLASAANKRLKRFKEKGVTSPAVSEERMFLERFSVKGKNLNQLRSEYVRVKEFLQSETSTLRGWNRVVQETTSTLHDMGVNIPKEHVPGVMKVYGRLKSEFPDLVGNKEIYAPVVQQIYDRMLEDTDPDQIINEAKDTFIRGYENRERLNYGFETGGVSDFF